MESRTIIHNIKKLYTSTQKPPVKGKNMAEILEISNAYIVIENERILAFGEGDYTDYVTDNTVFHDAKSGVCIPGLIDSHTHLVYGGSREKEFGKKLEGIPYLEILKAGGGILNTVDSTRKATFYELYNQAKKSLDIMLSYGVTTIEAKSGYGLNLETEIKQLKVLKELNKDHPIDIHSTYLGAHALPKEFKNNRTEYIKQVLKDLEVIKDQDLAEFVDVFCEVGVFTADETETILSAAKKLGFLIRLHSDEIESIGGTKIALDLNASTIDHLMAITDQDMILFAKTNTIANLLPSTSFFLNKEYAPARKMIENNMALAISSDYNPGSTPSENYQLTLQIAANKMRMTPKEVLTAATINPAFSLKINDEVGTITVGKFADLVILDVKNLDYFIYHYGINHVQDVFKKGRLVVSNQQIIKE